MADGKRASGGAGAAGAGSAPKIPVATPNIGGPANMVPLDTALASCIGARIRLTTVLQTTLEGTLFTADPLTNLIAITTTPPPPTPASTSTSQTPLPGDYRIIPISKLQSFQLLALAPDASSSTTTTSAPQDVSQAGPSPGLKKIDWNALRARERAAVEKELKKERSRGQGVGKEAQDIFDALNRTLPVRWHEQNIIVLDAVMIRPPYGPDDCKAPIKDAMALQRVKKVLEMEKRKMVDRNNSSRGGGVSSTGTSTPVGAGGSNVTTGASAGANTPVSTLPGPGPGPTPPSSSSGPVNSAAAVPSVPPPLVPVPVPIPAVVGPRKGG